VVDYGDTIDVPPFALRRRRGQYPHQFCWERPDLLFPTWRQLAGPIILLPHSGRETARAGVVALNNGIVLMSEVPGIRLAALVIFPVFTFALALTLIFGRDANGR